MCYWLSQYGVIQLCRKEMSVVAEIKVIIILYLIIVNCIKDS